MQMDTIARGYLAYDLTGQATALGFVWVAWGVPMLLLSLIAGVVADRVEKRGLLMLVQAGMAVLSLSTAILVHTDVISIWQLVALGVGQGVVWSFAVPARMAMLPELVTDEELTNALALNNAAMNGTRILGPSLAGGLIAVPLFGMSGVFYVMVLLYVVVALTLLPIPRSRSPVRQRGPLWEEMGVGLRYMSGRRMLIVLMLMGFVPILLGMSYAALLPVFAKDVHDVGSLGFGLMGTRWGRHLGLARHRLFQPAPPPGGPATGAGGRLRALALRLRRGAQLRGSSGRPLLRGLHLQQLHDPSTTPSSSPRWSPASTGG
jgi:MFS family permease